jgi:hypothetical protein
MKRLNVRGNIEVEAVLHAIAVEILPFPIIFTARVSEKAIRFKEIRTVCPMRILLAKQFSKGWHSSHLPLSPKFLA